MFLKNMVVKDSYRSCPGQDNCCSIKSIIEATYSFVNEGFPICILYFLSVLNEVINNVLDIRILKVPAGVSKDCLAL